MTKRVIIATILFLSGFGTAMLPWKFNLRPVPVQYINVPTIEYVDRAVEIEKPVVQYITLTEVKPIPSVHYFESGSQFLSKMDEYSKGISVLKNNVCVEVALTLVDQARKDGFYCDTEIIQEYYQEHAVVKAIILDKREIWLYDHFTQRGWKSNG